MLQISFFRRSWIMLVNSFCIAPALFDEIQLAVKFQQEDDLNSMRFAVSFKQAFHHGKIWLIIENLTVTAICSTFVGTSETCAFTFCSSKQGDSLFLQNNLHSLNKPSFGWPGGKYRGCLVPSANVASSIWTLVFRNLPSGV